MTKFNNFETADIIDSFEHRHYGGKTMSVKSKRRACLLLAASLILTIFSPVFLDNKASAEGINGTFLTGEESSSYVAKPDIIEEIDNYNYISCDFSNAQRVNDLFVYSETLSNTAVKPDGFTVSQKIENGALQIQNSISSGKYNAGVRDKQLGYIYGLRSVYQRTEPAFVSGEIEFEEKSSYDTAVAAIWLGETGENTVGVALKKDNKNIYVFSVAMNKQTGKITYRNPAKNVPVNNINGYKWSFEVYYIFNYETASYRYSFTVVNEDGERGVPINLDIYNPTISAFRDITTPVIGFSVASDASKNGYINFNSLMVEFDNAYDDEEKFIEKNSYAYSLQTETVSVIDKASINNLLADYATLPLREKSIFFKGYQRVKKLLDKIAELENAGKTDAEIIRAGSDYSKWTEQFQNEDAIRKLRTKSPANSFSGDFTDDKCTTVANATIKYDEKLNKNTLRLESAGSNIWGIKEATLPEKAVATEFSFNVRVDSGDFSGVNRFYIYADYTDSNNYQCFQFNRNKQGGWMCIGATCVDGVYTGTGCTIPDLDGIDFERWVSVNIVYSETKISVMLSQMDDAEIACGFAATRRCKTASPAISPAMSFFTTQFLSSLLVSDWDIKLKKGEFVLDEKTNSTVVYYTGNSTYKSGETILVYGDNLNENVDSVEIAQVGNVYEPSNAKYVFETAYDKGSKREKSKSFEAADNFSTLTWQSARILQWTADSFKIRIPETYDKNAVYAVKLNGRDGNKKIIYINEPEVDYAVGNEGKECTYGGELQLSGKSLAIGMKENGGQNVAVQVRKKDDPSVQYVYTVANGDVTVDSDYSIIWNVPSNFAIGKYEISVYNGFGDNNAWSEPYTFDVIEPRRNSWGRNSNGDIYTVDITSLGATGNRDQNATPYFVKALEILSDNGGGILYMPNGWYQLQFSIVIPENVQVIGESEDKTVVYFLPLYFQYFRLPSYAIGFNSNVSFENFTIYSTRLATLFKSFESEKGENVYFKNVRYDKYTFHGTPSNTAAGGVTSLIADNKVLLQLIDMEHRKTAAAFWEFKTTITNFQADNFDVNIAGETFISGYWSSRDYSKIQNCDWDMVGFSGMTGSHQIYMNNVFDKVSQALGGNGVYYSGCFFGNETQNNKEMLVADEGLVWGANQSGIMTKQSDTIWDLSGINAGTTNLSGRVIAVVTGQGSGQTRKIVKNSGARIEIDQPFEVEPNKNSRVIICTDRADHVFYNNRFHRGASGAYYGYVAGSVYDSNVHTQHGNFDFYGRNSMVLWYVTIKDSDFSDPIYLHNIGTGPDEQSAQNRLCIVPQSGQNSAIGITIKNNTMDGYYIELSLGESKGRKDFIIENNYLENVKEAILTADTQTTSDGILYHNNIFNNVEVGYRGNKNAGYNKQRSPVALYDDTYDTSLILKGDVNLDGEISIKDVTIIRYYLIGMAELSARQLTNADVYPDGKVTAKDATIIRNYILGNITSFDEITADSEAPSIPTESEESSSSSSGSGENPSSSESSSGSTSSGGTSSDGEWIPGRY